MTQIPVRKSSLPTASLLNQPDQHPDYADSYSAVLQHHERNLPIENVGKAFFTSGPAWVDKLFAFRDKLAGRVGLRTSGAVDRRQQWLDNFNCEVGERVGLFRVFAKNDQEVILGEDDTHLNFRVSLFVGELDQGHSRELIVSTVVQFHNWLGRLYFLPVKQFHRLIVPTMLKGMIKQLQRGAAA